jgi:hypothetical protein
MFASELAKAYNYDTALYVERLDRMLMYLGRYAKQDAVALERTPTATVRSWVRRTEEILEEEAAEARRHRG